MSTTRQMRQLARTRLDARLEGLRSLPRSSHLAPRGGWIRAIREALGMPRRVLGKRMGVGEKRIAQLELGEVKGKLNIDSLKRAAQALDCELVLALVPRNSLQKLVDDKRAALASAWLESRVIRTMELEGQGVELNELPAAALYEVEHLYPDERLWD